MPKKKKDPLPDRISLPNGDNFELRVVRITDFCLEGEQPEFLQIVYDGTLLENADQASYMAIYVPIGVCDVPASD